MGQLTSDRATEGSSLILTSKEMALQVLGVQVCLGAVRARELAVRILDRNNGALRRTGSGGGGGRPAGSAGKNAPAALRAHDVGWLLRVLKDRVGLHQRTGTIRRGDAGLRHDAAGGHRAQDGRPAAADGSREQWAAGATRPSWL